MNKLCLLLFLAAVSVAAAQLKCPTPQAWTARMLEVNSRFDRFAKISYDEMNNRTRILEEVFIDEEQEREYYDEIFLHNKKVGYRINLKTKFCEKFPLNEPFRKIGVPIEARLDGELVIGTNGVPGAGVRIQVYDGETPRGRYVGEWIPADHLCLPVSDFYFDRTDRRFSHWNFFNIEVGVDPEHFIPPEECM